MSLPLDVHRLLPSFLCAARNANFSAAARQLGVTPAAISKNIRVLEDKLAVSLFQRNTHQVLLTPQGQTLLNEIEPIWQTLSQILTHSQRDASTQPQVIRIYANNEICQTLLNPLIVEFLQHYPEINLIIASPQRLSEQSLSPTDCIVGDMLASSQPLLVQPLKPLRKIIAAAPRYLNKAGFPQQRSQLAQHQCLLQCDANTGNVISWYGEAQETLPCRLCSPCAEQLLTAALRGLGIVCLAQTHLEKALHHGRLVALAEEMWPSPQGLWLSYPPDSTAEIRLWSQFVIHALGMDNKDDPLRHQFSSQTGH